MPHRCKNGARNILFLWVGADSSPDIRAALAIQSVHVGSEAGQSISPDHVQVSQGSEPPLLAAVCAAQLGHPMVVLNCKSRSLDNRLRDDVGVVVIEVCAIHLGLLGQRASAFEVTGVDIPPGGDSSQDAVLPSRARVYVHVEAGRGEEGGRCHCRVVLGRWAGKEVEGGAMGVVRLAPLIAATLMEGADRARSGDMGTDMDMDTNTVMRGRVAYRAGQTQVGLTSFLGMTETRPSYLLAPLVLCCVCVRGALGGASGRGKK